MQIPTHVLTAYGLRAAQVEPLSGGLINATYLATQNGRACVVQRLHPIFGQAVNDDLDAVTQHLAHHGLETPRLIRTSNGAACIKVQGDVWRAITYIDGITQTRIEQVDDARTAGELVGRVHAALADFQYEYVFTRAGVHDTAAHLARLDARIAGNPPQENAKHADRDDLARQVQSAVASCPPLPALPRRHCHGDLKISNVLFERSPRRARCLIDLDTWSYQSIAYELGDMLRSWANHAGEDATQATLSEEIVHLALRGFRAGAGHLLTPTEIDAIIPGLATICLELAARFAVDAYDDSYFGWDATRFSSRVSHNIVRARGQLALYRAVNARRRALGDLARAAFAD